MKSAIVHLLSLISNGAKPFQTGDLPTELKLLQMGPNSTRKGNVILGAKTQALFAANQRALGFDRVALDFEHNTVKGTPAFSEASEPRPVAAYGIPTLRPDGLYLTNLEWTPSGMRSARDFYDLSPAVQLENGEVTFLHSAALCRQGAVDGLHFYTLDLVPSTEPQNPAFKQEEDELMDKIRALLLKGLGLAETATDDEIAAKLAGMGGMQTTLTALSAKLDDLNAQAAKMIEENKKLLALSAGVEGNAATIATLQASLEKAERSAILRDAMAAGKVIPLTAEQIAATPVATLTTMVAALPVTVPLSARTPGNVQEFAVTAGEPTEQQKQIAIRCGMDPAKVFARK